MRHEETPQTVEPPSAPDESLPEARVPAAPPLAPHPGAASGSDTPGVEPDPELGVPGWRAAWIASIAIYVALKLDVTGVHLAGPGSTWERWLVVCQDHPVRTAMAVGAAALAVASAPGSLARARRSSGSVL